MIVDTIIGEYLYRKIRISDSLLEVIVIED